MDKPVKHAEGVVGGGDLTLCGFDVAGAGITDGGEDNIPPLVATIGETVTCPTCRQIIDQCKRFRRYVLNG
jgi:hypothetical protein